MIAAPQAVEATVRRALAQSAVDSWESSGAIRLAIFNSADARNATLVDRMIRNAIRGCDSPVTVVVMHGVSFRPSRLPGNVSLVQKRPTASALEGSVLDDLLLHLRLDWLSAVTDALSHWMHFHTKREHIIRWLDQFDALGSFRWVGERLLRVLRFWSGAALGQALGISADGVQGFRHVCVVSHTAGKSGAVIGSLARKRLLTAGLAPERVSEFADVLENANDSERVLLLEDGLFSGTELIGVLQSLLGTRPEGRAPKAAALSDPTKLKRRQITLRFGIVTNLGYHLVRQFLSENELNNIFVANSVESHWQTLTPEGLKALQDQSLFVIDSDKARILRDPDHHIQKIAFRDSAIWGPDDRRQRAIAFCREVGSQLWAAYLDHVHRTASPERIAECALGMRSQALAVAFAHSVPKGSLPLFWARGVVTKSGKTVSWEPLFQNAY